MDNTRPLNVGIVALQLYTPNTFVDQQELEAFDGVSSGKYTVGLGQKKMAAFSDREDAVSMALTVVGRLLSNYKISPTSIGRLEVGTESGVDKSKSIKSFLMQLLQSHGNTNVEGVDNVNACYGGTASLFNTCAWVESSGWDGRFGLVVASDVAVYARGNARPAGGGGAVAMLVGPNAPLVLEPGLRYSHFEHVFDFYKADPHSEFPLVDGVLSNACYMRSISKCWNGIAKKGGLSTYKFACFHSPYNKLVRKSFAQLVVEDFKQNSQAEQYQKIDKEIIAKGTTENDLLSEETIKHVISATSELYEKMVGPGAQVGQLIGNMYTASLYGSLVGLVANTTDQDLVGSRALLFSYGSGLASSIFCVRIVSSVENMRKALDLTNLLDSRVKVSPEIFTQMLAQRESRHGQKEFETSNQHNFPTPNDVYVLKGIDSAFRREYLKQE